jgi:hypothetical protein
MLTSLYCIVRYGADWRWHRREIRIAKRTHRRAKARASRRWH